MDKKDSAILEILRRNSKLTTSQIAKKTGMPITTVHNRIRKMERSGTIRKYIAIPDYKKIDKGVLSYVLLTVLYRGPGGEKYSQESIASKIRKMPDVEEVSIVAGITDILVKVRVKDIETLNDFIIKRLRDIEGVDKTQTMVVLSEVYGKDSLLVGI